MSTCLILYECLKDDIGKEIEETISDLSPKVQGELLTIDVIILVKGMIILKEVCIYLYFYCWCF